MKPLIILIGDNNISNYALVKFLKKRGFDFDSVGVVFTKKTKTNAENLKKLLSEKFIDIDVENEKENYLAVKEKIAKKLNEIGKIEKIFLDYTGGLKSMSLGAFLAVNEYDLEDDKKYITYVLYQTNEIIFKRGDRYKLDEPLSIEEIAKVHGFENLRYKTENSDFFSLKSVNFLLEKIEKAEKEFFEKLWDLDIKELKELNWQDSIKNSPLSIVNSNKKLEKLQKYIRGDFLEEYIFYLLNEIKNEAKIYQIAWNIREGENSDDFEIDVMASKRNRLYLFSCTTDKKAHVKNKGFEVFKRAMQLGGKNAKYILVSCANEKLKEKLKKDLDEKAGGEKPEIIIFEDLIDQDKLKQKLMEIFK